VPGAYLIWLVESAQVRDRAVREAARGELGPALREQRRQGHDSVTASPPGRLPAALLPLAHEIVERGFRLCARQHHPGHGGDHRGMVQLNDTVPALRALIGGKTS
jgi:hypothetical protein